MTFACRTEKMTQTHTHTLVQSPPPNPHPPKWNETQNIQVLNICLDVLAEIEMAAREREESMGAAAASGAAGGGHVRTTGSGHLHGAEAEAYEEALLEELQYEEGMGPHGVHAHLGSTYAPHPLVQALVAANDAVARVELKGCLEGALGAARWVGGWVGCWDGMWWWLSL
jgi:hypothetical protein